MEHKYIDNTLTITEDDKESIKNDSDIFYQDFTNKTSNSNIVKTGKNIKVKTEKLQKFKDGRRDKYSFVKKKSDLVVDCKNGKFNQNSRGDDR